MSRKPESQTPFMPGRAKVEGRVTNIRLDIALLISLASLPIHFYCLYREDKAARLAQ